MFLRKGLQWKHGMPCFVTGAYALLTLGPGASNMSGGMAAADRIVPLIEAHLAKSWKNKKPSSKASIYSHPLDGRDTEFHTRSRKIIGSYGDSNMYASLPEE
jgi:hypothetical protein